MSKHKDVVLDPKSPCQTARLMIEKLYSTEDSEQLLWRCQKGFWLWSDADKYYRPADKETITAHVRIFMEKAKRQKWQKVVDNYGSKGGEWELEDFNPMIKHVKEVVAALISFCLFEPRQCLSCSDMVRNPFAHHSEGYRGNGDLPEIFLCTKCARRNHIAERNTKNPRCQLKEKAPEVGRDLRGIIRQLGPAEQTYAQ
jgi:hypothetical protein